MKLSTSMWLDFVLIVTNAMLAGFNLALEKYILAAVDIIVVFLLTYAVSKVIEYRVREAELRTEWECTMHTIECLRKYEEEDE